MRRRNLFVPLLVITLLCVGLVEVGYFALEYFVLRRAEQVTGAFSLPVVPGEIDKEGVAVLDDPALIVARNLFRGAPVRDAEAASSAVEEESEEKVALNIVLMGTVGGDTPRAFILDKLTSRQQVYEVGDEVQDMLVMEITRGRVTLLRENREEVLDLSEAALLRPTYQAADSPAGEAMPTDMPAEPGSGLPEGGQIDAQPVPGPGAEGQPPRSRQVRLPRPSGAPAAESGETVTQ
jgi:hypothetical protein